MQNMSANFGNESGYAKKVIYPGLKNHPQHEFAKSQMRGFGGMISADLAYR